MPAVKAKKAKATKPVAAQKPAPEPLPKTPREAVNRAGRYLIGLLRDVPYSAVQWLEAQHPELARAEQQLNAAILATNSTARAITMASKWMHVWQAAVAAHRDPETRQIVVDIEEELGLAQRGLSKKPWRMQVTPQQQERAA